MKQCASGEPLRLPPSSCVLDLASLRPVPAQAIHAELHEARKQQQAEKERRLAEQAKFERDEFERIIQARRWHCTINR